VGGGPVRSKLVPRIAVEDGRPRSRTDHLALVCPESIVHGRPVVVVTPASASRVTSLTQLVPASRDAATHRISAASADTRLSRPS
jgi:hypothetical protein